MLALRRNVQMRLFDVRGDEAVDYLEGRRMRGMQRNWMAFSTASMSARPKSKINSSFRRHWNLCSVCHCPQRESIEAEFVMWEQVEVIGRRYGVGRSAVYRHAHATGLFPQRQRNISKALQRLCS